MEILKGIPVSAGVAIAEAYIFESSGNIVIPRRFIRADEVEREQERFFGAVQTAQQEIRDLQTKVLDEMGGEAAPIFDAHIMILADSSLHQEVVRRITANRFSAEYAVSRSLRKFEKAFYAMADPYLAQRVSDIQDIERRLLRALTGSREQDLSEVDRKVVLVAHDLSPSQTAGLDRERFVSFVTDVGGATGHTAIIAMAREIPAIVGLNTATTDISSGDMLIVDGTRGIVVIDPDEEMLARYRQMETQFQDFEQQLFSEKDLPAQTTDGTLACVLANIEFPEEVTHVQHYGADGVGLFRTEFLYLQHNGEPTEEEHYQAYRKVIEGMGGKTIVIRTLDLGADKFFQKDSSLLQERNPFLGCRSIRYCRLRPEIFRTQMRALCRASACGPVKVMLPLVSTVDEVKFAHEILEKVQEDLANDDIPFDPDMELGIMVEIPGTALTLEHFVEESAFFSIGTNDLIQYTLAVDRTNEHVADLYQASSPAVLQLIRMTLQKGMEHDRPVSLCGEMGGNPLYVLLLLGLGLRTFSVSAPLVPEVKKLIRSVSLTDAEVIATQVMSMSNSRDVTAYLRGKTKEILPEWTFM